MEDNRIQIKFSNPDIDGTSKPQLITLEQENPIEGTTEREDGGEYVWHKWLCTNDQYFMASASLDGMLKLIPEKLGKVLKIEKVVNPKPNGYPFFQINGMNKDQLVTQANVETKLDDIEPTMPQLAPSQPATTDNAIDRLEQKLDKVIAMLEGAEEEAPVVEAPAKEEALPF